MEQELQALQGQGAPRDRVEAFTREVADFRDALRRTASRDASARSEVDRKMLSIGLPALAGLAIDPLASLVDTAMIGRSRTALALMITFQVSLADNFEEENLTI